MARQPCGAALTRRCPATSWPQGAAVAVPTASDRRDRRADVDARAARADRHLRRPQMKRPLGQLMADRRCRSHRPRSSSTVAERRRVRPAGDERRERQQQLPTRRLPRRTPAGERMHDHAGWYTLAHVLAVRAAPGRRRARVRHAADDRAGADAHLLGRHVLPLRVPRDFDRAVRPERQRRVRVRRAPAPRPLLDRRAAVAPIADLRGLH